MKSQGFTTQRTLPLAGRCACVRGAWGGERPVLVTLNERHALESLHLHGSLGYEDRIHPGRGGA